MSLLHCPTSRAALKISTTSAEEHIVFATPVHRYKPCVRKSTAFAENNTSFLKAQIYLKPVYDQSRDKHCGPN